MSPSSQNASQVDVEGVSGSRTFAGLFPRHVQRNEERLEGAKMLQKRRVWRRQLCPGSRHAADWPDSGLARQTVHCEALLLLPSVYVFQCARVASRATGLSGGRHELCPASRRASKQQGPARGAVVVGPCEIPLLGWRWRLLAFPYS